LRVGDIAAGRSGDKGDILDLTLVAIDDASYERLKRALTAEQVASVLERSIPGNVVRYEVPRLRALKYVVSGALPGGVYASLRAGVHWQKSAAYLLLDLELND